MKATPFLEEMLHLATLFLRKSGYKHEAALIEGQYSLPAWVQEDNPLIKKGFAKIIKEYVKSNSKIQEYYENRCEEEEESEEEEKIETKSKKQSHKKVKEQSPKVTAKANGIQIKYPRSPKSADASQTKHASGWMSQFQNPKRLEDLNSPKPTQMLPTKEKVEIKTKAHKKTPKQEAIESEDYESEEDSFELEPTKKQKKDAKAEKKQLKRRQKEKELLKTAEPKEPKVKKVKQVKKQVQMEEEEEQVEEKEEREEREQKEEPSYSKAQPTRDGFKKFFSRVDASEVGPIKAELRDNSFQAKGKYGQAADAWGQFGFDKLNATRGDSFKKTKGKLKNRDFQGSLMDINKINSIPIL